jgi:biotin carboxylase
MAGAIGIRMAHSEQELKSFDHELGDQRSFYLVERFVPGDVCHVDSIVYENEILFAAASQYGYPPLDVSHRGGIFTTRLLERGSSDAQALLAGNQRVRAAMGLLRGVSHTEFIKGDDGELYFLETAARVGGAHIAELVEAATGLNLWAEWAKIEIAGGKLPYTPPQPRDDYAALLVSLAKQEYPDTSAYADPEIVWRMQKRHHVGMIVKSARRERVAELLAEYVERVKKDFATVAPPRARPSD